MSKAKKMIYALIAWILSAIICLTVVSFILGVLTGILIGYPAYELSPIFVGVSFLISIVVATIIAYLVYRK